MGDALIGPERALYRLLHHRSVRTACSDGRWEVLGLTGPEEAALTGLDWAQVEQLATQIREDLLRREHRGSGSLLRLYPGTIRAWLAAYPGEEDAALLELASRFMESDAYEAYQEVVAVAGALSLEEAFHRFCESVDLGERALREDEFLSAMARALVVNPLPSFAVPPQFRRVRAGWLAVGTADPPKLYAAVAGRLMLGALTPFLAELLQPGIDRVAAARRHGESIATLQEAVAELSGLGLLD